MESVLVKVVSFIAVIVVGYLRHHFELHQNRC